MVRIKTIDNTVVPYMSAINLKFKIEKKWFSNQFFVTLNSWNAQYHAILGYDFLQRNKVVIDTVNKQLLVGNQKFDFEENSPTNVCSETTDYDISESDKNKKESFEQINNNFGEKGNVSEETFHALNVKIYNNITVQPFSTEIINLKVPKNIAKNKDLIFIPKKNKLGYLINESLNVPTNANLFHTIIENNTNKVIHVRKNTIMGKLSTFDVNDIMSPSESEIYQINNLNLNEIHKMRRDELLKSDFKLDHLNDKDKKDMQDLLLKNYKVFSKSYKTLGETSAVIPEFSLLHNFPLQTKPYSIPLMAKKYAQQEINNLLEAGIIEQSSSSYCFPVIFIKKKQNPNDNNSEPKFRMVVDYRLLNSITETFKICLPKISEIIKNIAGRKIYCVLDLKSAFFQIKLRDEDKRKLAFCTEMGNFQPTRLPFGSKNSTSYFHTLISKCLNGITGKNVQFFLDDIIIAADSLCELKVTLQTVFDRLTKFNLTLDPAKLQLCKPEITYLGFDLNANGFSPSEQNVNKVTNFPRPKNLKQVQMFLGMLNYFRGLIYDYAGIVEPLVKLTKKNTPFVWSVECENAFNTVQEIILKKPTLKNFDPNLPISLITDASKIAICGILLQKKDNVYYPLQNITSRTIINCLNKYFANFGLPKFLITDNATNFISNEMVEFLDRLNIQHRKSSIYYPMANGLLERAHRTMKESLASMCESTFQWSEKLLFFKLYYNNSIHSVTKFAPAEIFFGRKQNLPLDSFFEPITVENESKYLKNIRNNMCSIRNEFAKNEEQYFKNNAPHIKGRKVPNFNLGDKVFVKNFSHPHVFQEKYKGPFEIIKILRSNNYVIKSLKDNKTMKLNVSKIIKQEQPRPNLRN
ncbi:Retrovirus-related Pol polyprotein from transposon 17.6 [Araneus ventricosus]|uniref:RNA-directed DNA polymerase n=1 Tax=Araneus ventricosus TaxID=182803 RepID=A0A4Y2AP19_ARAVE|nr:Retrovirus-related Pol polyprotein from transposon 17.6 [Araneus ventricosus]GBL81518.1 Retrovirus-related Pol polyprotein from transposon 17.6 [Araneus ventricosus]